MSHKILIVDDDKEMCELLMDVLKREGYDVSSANSGESALQMVENNYFDLIITDLRMKGMDGIELLTKVKEKAPCVEVIIITGFGTIERAIEAIKKGAYHFVTKPFKNKELLNLIEKALSGKILSDENRRLRREVEQRYSFSNIIGKSKGMQEIFRTIELISHSLSNVLIIGESGTGKELIAKSIHYNSPRKNGAFIPVNCSAIPEGLLESELFGHIKGAFTGAYDTRKGLFLEASGGTLFLDEIGDMSFSLQAKLLRVLQDKVVRPVGSNKSFPTDTRIISATLKDLKVAIKEKSFREDLYYRLSVIPIYIPPLKERKEDIPLLVEHFLKNTTKQLKIPEKNITKKAMDCLVKYHWEGNVRELENVIERTVVLTRKDEINVDDLPDYIVNNAKMPFFQSNFDTFPMLSELEEKYILHVLKYTKGNKEKAAKILGINRRTLYRRNYIKSFSKEE